MINLQPSHIPSLPVKPFENRLTPIYYIYYRGSNPHTSSQGMTGGFWEYGKNGGHLRHKLCRLNFCEPQCDISSGFKDHSCDHSMTLGYQVS